MEFLVKNSGAATETGLWLSKKVDLKKVFAKLEKTDSSVAMANIKLFL